MEARYQLRQSPLSVTRRPRHKPDRSYIRGPGRANRTSSASVEEDRQPARVVGVKEYGPEHAVEDQVHADHVR
jgi:hypothetical protein